MLFLRALRCGYGGIGKSVGETSIRGAFGGGPLSPATAPKPCETPSLRRSRHCPNSSAAPWPGTRAPRWPSNAQLRADADLDVYFCDPHSPWQRGTNGEHQRSHPSILPQRHRPLQHSRGDLDAPSLQPSTVDPTKPPATGPQPRPSTSTYTPSNKAVLRRPLEPGQYTSRATAQLWPAYGIAQSVGRTGVCWDNAAAESFLGTLHKELVNRNNYQSRHHARLSIRWSIEGLVQPPPAPLHHRATATERMGGQLLPSHGRINQVSSTWGELQTVRGVMSALASVVSDQDKQR